MPQEQSPTAAVAALAGTDEDLDVITGIAAPLPVELITLQYGADPDRVLKLSKPVQMIIIIAATATAAEHQLLRAYRHNGQLLQGPLKTLLLCDHEHAADAYASCLEGVFDDYLVFQPLQDPDRLRLAIRQALRTLRSEAAEQPAASSGSSLDNSIDTLKDAAQSQSRQLCATADTLCDKTLGQLDDELSGLPGALRDQDLLQDDEAYRKTVDFFQAYRNGKLQPIVDDARDRLQQAIRGFESLLGEQIAALSDKHHGIRPLGSRRPDILVVASDKGFRMTLCQQLMHEGYDVSFAETSTQAIMLMSREKPRLVLMEVRPRDHHGIECIRLAKKLPITRDIPIVMMSGDGSQSVQDGYAAGASGFLDTPIRYGELKTTLERYAPLGDN